MLAVAVWWLNKKSETTAAALAQSTKEAAERATLAQNQFIATLNAEREDRITILEANVKDCEKDRFDLRERLIKVLQDQQAKFEVLVKEIKDTKTSDQP